MIGVPAVFINGRKFSQGRMTLIEIATKADTGTERYVTEELNKCGAYDILTVNSNPTGTAAAVYSTRKSIRTSLMGKRSDGRVLDTVDIENYVSASKIEG